MTTTALRNKVVNKVSLADERLLKLVHALITKYEETVEDEYELAPAEKKEIDKRMKLYTMGKMKTHSIEEVRKKIKQQLKK